MCSVVLHCCCQVGVMEESFLALGLSLVLQWCNSHSCAALQFPPGFGNHRFAHGQLVSDLGSKKGIWKEGQIVLHEALEVGDRSMLFCSPVLLVIPGVYFFTAVYVKTPAVILSMVSLLLCINLLWPPSKLGTDNRAACRTAPASQPHCLMVSQCRTIANSVEGIYKCKECSFPVVIQDCTIAQMYIFN